MLVKLRLVNLFKKNHFLNIKLTSASNLFHTKTLTNQVIMPDVGL
jgi:hypothetical protein